MISFISENLLSILLGILFIFSILYIIYLKTKMVSSKASFALSVVASIIACLIALLNFLSGSIFVEIISLALSTINHIAGRQIITTTPPGPPSLYGILGTILALIAIVAIWRFGDRAIIAWDTRPTITVSELAKQNRDNSLVFLALAEAARLAKRQPDLIASEAALNWKQRTVEAPLTPKWNIFARTLLCGAFSEILIEDNGWRDRILSWIGVIYFSKEEERKDIYLMVFSEAFSRDAISNRIQSMIAEGYDIKNAKFFAVFDTNALLYKRLIVRSVKVEVWTRASLLQKGLNFDAYARDLIRRFDYETLGGTSSTLSRTYVNAHVVRERRSSERYDLENLYDDWVRGNSRRHLAIVGEYGQGKSTAMLALCIKWARAYLKDGQSNGPVPLLVELRSQSPAETDPASFLAPWANRFGLDARRIYNLIQAGEVVLIFEGFDELRNAGRAYDRHEHFNALWRLAYPGTKLIFTGRPNFFIDEMEKNRTLRVDQSKGAAGNAYTELWEIDRLQPDEVMTALSGFDPEMARSVVAAADKYTSFRDIVSRPSMLPVVATIWPEIEDLQKRGQQLTDSVLIERYLDAAYQRKEAEIESYQRATGAPSGATYLMLPRELRETFTSLIVWDMVDRDTRNTITRGRLDKIVSDSYRSVFKVFQTIGSNPNTIAAIRSLELRYNENNLQDIPEILSNEIASAGLFVSDPVGGANNLRLPHKQYYEYIIAKTAYDATGASQRMRILIIGSEKNDSIIARNVLREPNSIAYFSGICGDNLNWFKVPAVRIIIGFQIFAISFVIGARKFSVWLSDRIKITVNFEALAIDDIVDAILLSVRSSARNAAAFAFMVGIFTAAFGVFTISVALPALGIDKLIRTFLVSFVLSFGMIVFIWFLSRSMSKAKLLELVTRYRSFHRGDWQARTDTILRRRRALYEALETIKR